MEKNTVALFVPRESDKIRSHRKEKAGIAREYALIDLDTGAAVVTLRIYWPGTVAYACVWIHHGETHARGAGKAGGYGYCKESAAAHVALADAGVTLENAIDGRGLSAIRDALDAIAAHLGIARHVIHTAHA
jgi:hypothetical protein